MSNFIKIKNRRIRVTGVKEYEPIGEKNLKIVFNHSRNKSEKEVFSFDNTQNRDDLVQELDNIL